MTFNNSSNYRPTQYDILVGGSNNQIASVGPGTAGQVVQSGGAAANPAYSTATYPSTAGAAGNVLTSDGTNIVSDLPGGLGFYGDGSDGSVTFDGTTVVLGITPVANVYTLLSDIFLSSATIDSGVTIRPNLYKIYCSGTIENNGTIQMNGNDAVLNTAGASISNATGSVNTGTSAGGGGAGGINAGSNGIGSIANTIGGRGGAGGSGASAGGNGGTISALAANITKPRALPYTSLAFLSNGSGLNTVFVCGTGGGGGGGDGTNRGGGGGGGGSVVVISSRFITGTGTISSNGGNGGDGAVAGTNCGGGGGGGGGVILITSSSVSSGAIAGQTITANGGNPGNPTGTGVIGSSGNTGLIVLLKN
jgi:hypothetical protein